MHVWWHTVSNKTDCQTPDKVSQKEKHHVVPHQDSRHAQDHNTLGDSRIGVR